MSNQRPKFDRGPMAPHLAAALQSDAQAMQQRQDQLAFPPDSQQQQQQGNYPQHQQMPPPQFQQGRPQQHNMPPPQFHQQRPNGAQFQQGHMMPPPQFQQQHQQQRNYPPFQQQAPNMPPPHFQQQWQNEPQQHQQQGRGMPPPQFQQHGQNPQFQQMPPPHFQQQQGHPQQHNMPPPQFRQDGHGMQGRSFQQRQGRNMPPPQFQQQGNMNAMNQGPNRGREHHQARPRQVQPPYPADDGAHNGVTAVPHSPLVPESPIADEPRGSPAAAEPGMAPARLVTDASRLAELNAQYAELRDGEASEAPMIDLAKVLETVEDNDVTFVVTDTGSGKSSLIPRHILESCPTARIISSQTRRTAAMALADRVADQCGTPLGEDVGFRVRGENISGPDTRLVFMTSYLLFLHVVANPGDLKVTHFIIDEFHERTPDIEITLALLRAARRRGLDFKIILLSATVNAEEWQSYFSGLSVGIYDETVPRYKIHTWHMEEIAELVSMAPVPVTPEALDAPIAPVTALALYGVMRELLALLATQGPAEHAILVFLPGRVEISKTAQWIATHCGDTLDAIEWFADIDLDKILEQIKRPPIDGRRKVYLATDIAEVSVTVPDAVFVIDTGLTRKPRITERQPNTVAFPALETVAIMRTSAIQRKGRVGRVRQGFYFGLLPRTTLPFLHRPEGQIRNCVLDSLTLHVLQAAENPRLLFNQAATRPRDVSLRLSLRRLLDTGAIVASSQSVAATERHRLETTEEWREEFRAGESGAADAEGAFFTTAKGQILQFLPLRIACSDLVFWGMLTGIPEAAIIAACIIEVGTPFFTQTSARTPSPEEREATRRRMLHFSGGVLSDIVAGVALVAEFKSIAEGATDASLQSWCVDNCASLSRIESILVYERSVSEAIAERLPSLPLTLTKSVLNDQLAGSGAKVLDLLVGVAFSTNSLWVEHEGARAASEKYAAKGLFLNLRAMQDHAAASTTQWPRKNVVVPTNLRLLYSKLIGSFTVQFDRTRFNALSMCTSAELVWAAEVDAESGHPTGRTISRYSRQGRSKFSRVSEAALGNVLLFRNAVCAQMEQLFMRVGAMPTPEELKAAFDARGGVPSLKGPEVLHRFLAQLLLAIAGDTTIADVPFPGDDYVPSHRSLLRAGATADTVAVPYDPADDVVLAADDEDPEIIED